jgi:hypothetical protein
MKKFKSQNPQYEFIRKRWTAKNRHYTQKFIDKHLRHIALGSLGGAMLLTTPGLSSAEASLDQLQPPQSITAATNKNLLLAAELTDKIPPDGSNLTREQEQQVTQLINKDLGVKTAAEIDGVRLNRTYGSIGGEQHLYRYPGDNLLNHARTTQDWAMYGGAGIAPGLGAWGYFAPSKTQMTPLDEERERYYIAVQTFLAPGFSENVAKYRDFFKYRKMLVVNPKTGQAVVADIADAGPGESTGKHLGGSPEVMQELGLAQGPRRGDVLYFFIDDPDNKVPLGPVKVPVQNQS